MKKVILAISVVAFLSLVLASCSSHERCPAYGEVEDNTPSNKV